MDTLSGKTTSETSSIKILIDQMDVKTNCSIDKTDLKLIKKICTISDSNIQIRDEIDELTGKKIPSSGGINFPLLPLTPRPGEKTKDAEISANFSEKNQIGEKNEFKLETIKKFTSTDDNSKYPSIAQSKINFIANSSNSNYESELNDNIHKEEQFSRKSFSKRRSHSVSQSPNSSRHQLRQEKNEKKSKIVLLPKEFMVGQNEFIKFVEAKPLKLELYAYANDRKKFDKNIIAKLKESLKNLPSNSATAIQNQIFEYSREAIKELFAREGFTLEDYFDHPIERISLLLSIIQNGGLLVKNILPQLVLLRNNLATYIIQSKEKSELTEQLYIYLQRLTEIDKLSTFKGTITCGKRINSFLATIEEILQINTKNPKEEQRMSKDLKYKNHLYDSTIIKDLILQAVEGVPTHGESIKEGSFANAMNIISTLKVWARSGEGGLSPNFQKLLAHCEKIAILCHKAMKLSCVEYHCFIEHFYRSTDSTEKLSKPGSFKKECKNSSSSFMFTRSAERVFTIKGEKIYNTSYSAYAIKNVVDSLIQNERIVPNIIKINDILFYAEDKIIPLSNFIPFEQKFEWKQWTPNDKTLNILTNFTDCCYKNKFGNVTNSTIRNQAELIKKYYDVPEMWLIRAENIHPPVLEEEIPCLKIAELMTKNCMNIAIGYMKQLFPDLFPELYNKSSPYSVSFTEGLLEHHISINNQKNYKVTQINQFNISLKEDSQEILATVTYSWKNEPTREDAKIAGWNAVLNINGKIHSKDHWEAITSILVNANDLSARKKINSGIHYTRVVSNKEPQKDVTNSPKSRLEKKKLLKMHNQTL